MLQQHHPTQALRLGELHRRRLQATSPYGVGSRMAGKRAAQGKESTDLTLKHASAPYLRCAEGIKSTLMCAFTLLRHGGGQQRRSWLPQPTLQVLAFRHQRELLRRFCPYLRPRAS